MNDRYKLVSGHLIVVGGGTSTSSGKTVIGASIARLLAKSGVQLNYAKFDGLLNRSENSGSRNTGIDWPTGEHYRTPDGSIVDSDLGAYFRATDIVATPEKHILNGDCFWNALLADGPEPKMLVTSVVPQYHRRICDLLSDVLILEIGGTLGDRENELFVSYLSALRRSNPGKVHVVIHALNESFETDEGTYFDTKASRKAVLAALERGIEPSLLTIRTNHSISHADRQIIYRDAMMEFPIIGVADHDSIERISIERDLIPVVSSWIGHELNASYQYPDPVSSCTIGILADQRGGSVRSLRAAINHACAALRLRPNIFSADTLQVVENCDIIFVSLSGSYPSYERLKGRNVILIGGSVGGFACIEHHIEFTSTYDNPTLTPYLEEMLHAYHRS